MKMHPVKLFISICVFTNLISAATVNGRFVVVNSDNSKVSVLLQINTNTGTDDMGGATIVFRFDTSLLYITGNPVRNIDYYFHNFSGGNYGSATITRPSNNLVWVNIDLPYNNNNNGTVAAGVPEWTDVVTINFDLVNSADSIKLDWLTSSPFWGIYDADNTTLWVNGIFENFNGRINLDNTPPLLLSALLLDPNTLELSFSEPLESVSASNSANYSITNGINISNVLVSSYKDKVTLSTSGHINGSSYLVIAQNVYDEAGNLICGDNNRAAYSCTTDNTAPSLSDVTVNNTQMLTLKFSKRLDLSSALDKNNYSLSGNISVISVQALPDSSGVVLKTGKQRDDTDYTLNVSNIRCRTGNLIAPNPSSLLYRTPKKGRGNPKRNDVHSAQANSSFQYFTADRTIDGKGMNFPHSRWQSGTAMPVEINYDLGTAQSIDSLRLSFYKWESGRMFEYSVHASEDSLNWTALVENVWSDNQEWTEIIFSQVQSKYVRLVIQRSNQGPFASIWEVELYGTDGVTSAGNEIQLPGSYELLQNYPNPFNPVTIISWQSPVDSWQTLKVYDILGNEVALLVDEHKTAGRYEVNFNAAGLASGVYVYRLTAGNYTETKKMVLLR